MRIGLILFLFVMLTGCNTTGTPGPDIQNLQPSQQDIEQSKLEQGTRY